MKMSSIGASINNSKATNGNFITTKDSVEQQDHLASNYCPHNNNCDYLLACIKQFSPPEGINLHG